MIITRLLFLSLFCILFTGCQTLTELAGDAFKTMDKPQVSFKNLEVANLTESEAELDLTLDISNPYPVPLFAESIGFNLLSNNEKILSGQTGEQIRVGAKSNGPVKMRVALPYNEAMKMLSGVKPGSVIPLTTQVDFALTGNNLAPMNFNVEKTTDVPVPAVPEVKVTSLNWDELSLTKAKANMKLDMKNTNSFPFDLNTLNYDFNLGGVPVSKGLINEGFSLGAGETQSIDLDFEIEPIKMGLAAFNILKNKDAGYNFNGILDAKTPYGPISWGLDQDGKTPMTSK